MLIYNLIEYSDNYSKVSGRLWQHYRDRQALTDFAATSNFHAANKSASFKFKQKITGNAGNANVIKDVAKIVPLLFI